MYGSACLNYLVAHEWKQPRTINYQIIAAEYHNYRIFFLQTQLPWHEVLMSKDLYRSMCKLIFYQLKLPNYIAVSLNLNWYMCCL